MNDELWVVTTEEGGDCCEVCGVFDSEERAERWIDCLREKCRGLRFRYEIQGPFTLNQPSEKCEIVEYELGVFARWFARMMDECLATLLQGELPEGMEIMREEDEHEEERANKQDAGRYGH